jgi:hypothetical protein
MRAIRRDSRLSHSREIEALILALVVLILSVVLRLPTLSAFTTQDERLFALIRAYSSR